MDVTEFTQQEMDNQDSWRYQYLIESSLFVLPEHLLLQWHDQLKTWCDRIDSVLRRRQHPELCALGAAIEPADRKPFHGS